MTRKKNGRVKLLTVLYIPDIVMVKDLEDPSYYHSENYNSDALREVMKLELDEQVNHDYRHQQHTQYEEYLEAVLALFLRGRLWDVFLLFRFFCFHGFSFLLDRIDISVAGDNHLIGLYTHLVGHIRVWD